MTREELLDWLNIRYVKLHFTLQLQEDTILPKDKVSALRGGMGEMLLRANCIRDRDCEECDFESECIVRRTIYSKFEKKPAFVTSGESVGYVLECEDYRRDFPAGSILNFNLLLFGKTIVYLNQYLQALHALGMEGLGRSHAQFQILAVTNTKKQPILKGNNIYMSCYQVSKISDYVLHRLECLSRKKPDGKLVFKTPLTLKYQGQFLQEFQMEAIVKAILRRFQMLNCFEGREEFPKNWDLDRQKTFQAPDILEQWAERIEVERYSSRQNQKMRMKGIRGELLLGELPDELLPILLAGELVHIGKNTSFGFGRYQVK